MRWCYVLGGGNLRVFDLWKVLISVISYAYEGRIENLPDSGLCGKALNATRSLDKINVGNDVKETLNLKK